MAVPMRHSPMRHRWTCGDERPFPWPPRAGGHDDLGPEPAVCGERAVDWGGTVLPDLLPYLLVPHEPRSVGETLAVSSRAA
jgi:hypothetical protein